MPRLVRISGGKLVKILQNLGFSVVCQRGSHVRMFKKQDGCSHYVTVPLHPIIDRGTLRSIVRSVSSCISEETIQELFYSWEQSLSNLNKEDQVASRLVYHPLLRGGFVYGASILSKVEPR